MKVLLVSDFTTKEVPFGGAELADYYALKWLKSCDHKVGHVYSTAASVELLESAYRAGYKIILSNRTGIRNKKGLVISAQTGNLEYFIMEHDFQFCRARSQVNIHCTNPCQCVRLIDRWQTGQTPIEMYQAANKVICVSQFQRDIFHKNLKLNNLEVLGCSWWEPGDLVYMASLASIPKVSKMAIPCPGREEKLLGEIKEIGVEIEYIPKLSHKRFLEEIAKYKYFGAFSKEYESFSRTAFEAAVCGCEVITNDNIGIAYEPWWNSNLDLINIYHCMRDRFKKILNGEHKNGH